jgi:hypothetical protein
MKSAVVLAIGLLMVSIGEARAAAMLTCGAANGAFTARVPLRAEAQDIGAGGPCISHETYSASLKSAASPTSTGSLTSTAPARVGWSGPVQLPEVTGRPQSWSDTATYYRGRWYGAWALHNGVLTVYRGFNRYERDPKVWRGEDMLILRPGSQGPITAPPPGPVPLPSTAGLLALGFAAVLLMARGGRRRGARPAVPMNGAVL